MEDKKELINECYCGKGGDLYTSETGYKLCFTCGQHNVPINEEIIEKFPKLYQVLTEVSKEGEVFTPYMFNSDKATLVLDLDDNNEKVWRLIPIENGVPNIKESIHVPYNDFFVIFNILNQVTD